LTENCKNIHQILQEIMTNEKMQENSPKPGDGSVGTCKNEKNTHVCMHIFNVCMFSKHITFSAIIYPFLLAMLLSEYGAANMRDRDDFGGE